MADVVSLLEEINKYPHMWYAAFDLNMPFSPYLCISPIGSNLLSAGKARNIHLLS